MQGPNCSSRHLPQRWTEPAVCKLATPALLRYELMQIRHVHTCRDNPCTLCRQVYERASCLVGVTSRQQASEAITVHLGAFDREA